MIFQVRPVVSWYQIYLIHVFNCCLRQSSQAPTCSLHLPSNRGQSKLIMKLKAPLLVWFYQKRLSFCQPLSCLYWMRKFFKSINIVNFCLFCQLCMRCTAACSGYRSWSDRNSLDQPFLTWARCLRCHFFRGTQRCTPSSLDRNQACRWRNTELSENVPSQDCNKGKENGVLMKHKWRSIDTHECLPYLIFESHTF